MKRLIAFLLVLLSMHAYADGFDANDKVLYFNSKVLIAVIKNTFPQNLQLDVATKYVEVMDNNGNVSIADLITVCSVGNLDNAKCRNFINDLITSMGDNTIKPFYWADYVSTNPEPIRLQTYTSGDEYHKNPGLAPGEWALTFGWMQDGKFIKQYPQTKYIRGHSACTMDAGTPYTIDANKNYALNENTGEHCWCKMVGPEESPWAYNKSGDTMAGGCKRSCALECLSALRDEPMRAAMFSIVKLNKSNANTSDEQVIGNDLITAVTPPPPPKPKPAPIHEPEPEYGPQPDPCWKREWIDRSCYINLDGTKDGDINNPFLDDSAWGDFSGMSPGDWKIIFPCGAMITGVATCASNGGKTWLQKGTPRGEGEYCWCKAETESTPYNFTPVWVFLRNYDDTPYFDCASRCAENCIHNIAVYFEPRSALFGLKYEEYDD